MSRELTEEERVKVKKEWDESAEDFMKAVKMSPKMSLESKVDTLLVGVSLLVVDKYSEGGDKNIENLH